MVNEMVKDIKAGGDGSNLRVSMDMPIYEFNNGRFLKTDLNEYSEGEIISSGISGATLTLPGNTGINKAVDVVESLTLKTGAKGLVNEVTKE